MIFFCRYSNYDPNAWQREASKHQLRSLDGFQRVIDTVRARRRSNKTRLNAFSSRSHCVFLLWITTDPADVGASTSTLAFVDLAGSERVDLSGAEGAVLKEACEINKSLSAFQRMLRALNSGKEYFNHRDTLISQVLHPLFQEVQQKNGEVKLLVTIQSQSRQTESMKHSLQVRPARSHLTARI